MPRCPHCGSADVVGGRYFHLVTKSTATLPCTCGAAEGGVAALRTYARPTLLQEWGRLDGDGDWTTEEVEEVDVLDEEDGLTQVFCPTCVADADPDDWEVVADPPVEDKLGQAPFTACLGCGAEQAVT